MRLTDYQRRVIHNAVAECFGAGSSVRLFGSRTDDRARGGDIDLLVTTDMTDVDAIVRAEVVFQVALQRALGEQRIDVLVDYPGRTDYPPVFAEAARTGVWL